MKPVERVGDRFALERELGSGGMATVYLGRDEALDRSVAVKVLRGGLGDPDVASRFEREGRMAARLSHANVVQVYDAGKDIHEDRDVSYIVMEYVPGGDLQELIDKEGPLPGRRLSGLGGDIAAGLAHAHERGIIHRDIKPRNVLIDEYGNPKLTDFGIARALDGTAHMTRTGAYLGTAIYSAPEQLKGEEITPKSDVYSLGVTLYQAAVGEPPFVGNPMEVATRQMTQEPESPRARGARITPEMERVILSCLSKDPSDRPTAQKLQAKLLQAGVAAGAASEGADTVSGAAAVPGGSGQIRRISGRPAETVSLPPRTFRSGPSRGPLIVAAAAVVFLLFILLGLWSLTNGGPRTASDSSDSSGGNGAARQGEAANAGGAADGASGEGRQGGDGSSGGSGEQAGGATEQQGQAAEQTAEETKQNERTEQQSDSQSDTGPLPPTEEAAGNVFDMYVAAAESRFDDSWGYLSSGYQEEVGSVAGWEQRQTSLDYVQFAILPQATLDGREARVSFTAQETRSGTTQTVSGTWVCVSEDGEWKLDRLIEGGA